MSALTNTQPSTKNEDLTVDGHRIPHEKTLQTAAKLSIVEDRPIMMDYWTYSIDKNAKIGVQEDGQKMLIKTEEEYTSYISKILSVDKSDYIIVTENSIYLVDSAVPVKRVSMN